MFLGALIIQLISFFIFTCIFLRFVYRVYRLEHNAWTLHRGRRWYSDWRVLTVALGVSCIGIIVCPLQLHFISSAQTDKKWIEDQIVLSYRRTFTGIPRSYCAE